MSDPLTCRPVVWRGAEAIELSNGRLAAVATARGGHLCSLRRCGDELDPLWQPSWAPEDDCGREPEVAALLRTICGSNLCCDRFGGPRPGERRPLHGEAGTAPWRIIPGSARVVLETWLPQARVRVRRRFALRGDSLLLDTAVRPGGERVRDIEWCEHTTLGGAFLDGVAISAGIGPIRDADGGEHPAGLAIPAPDAPPEGSVRSAAVRAGWWRAENQRLGAVLDARWDPRDFPWLALWTEHRSRADAPWLSRERTRGMEVSTKPFPAPTPADAPRGWRHWLEPGRWHNHRLALSWVRGVTGGAAPR
jgi:hypothetical protein